MTGYVQSDTDAGLRHLEDRFERLTFDLAERQHRDDTAAAALARLIEAHTDAIGILDTESRQYGRKINELEARTNQLLMNLATRGNA